eukprot:scaffold139938_cov38-Prasinocladus_malaysianus.AAC.2
MSHSQFRKDTDCNDISQMGQFILRNGHVYFTSSWRAFLLNMTCCINSALLLKYYYAHTKPTNGLVLTNNSSLILLLSLSRKMHVSKGVLGDDVCGCHNITDDNSKYSARSILPEFYSVA